MKNDVRRAVDVFNDPVTAIKPTSKGKMVLFCKDDTDKEAVKEKLVRSIGENYCIEEPKAHKPMLKIVGDIDHDMTSEQISECIKKQNGIQEPFTIEKIKRAYNSVVTISCEYGLFQKLLELGKIKIGWVRAAVFQAVNPVMCFRCNLFNHIEKNCPNTVDICPKCGGPHKIKDCTSTTTCCPNCHRKNVKFNTNKATNHLPWSFSCPIFKRKTDVVKKRINYEK